MLFPLVVAACGEPAEQPDGGEGGGDPARPDSG